MKPKIYTAHYHKMIEAIKNPEIKKRAQELNTIRIVLEYTLKHPHEPLRRRRAAKRYVEVMEDYREIIKRFNDQNEIIYLYCIITIELLATLDELALENKEIKKIVGTNTALAFKQLNTAAQSLRSMKQLLRERESK